MTELSQAVPQTVSGTTSGAIDRTTGTCGGPSGSPEVGFVFAAPATATYVLDTVGSSFDTVLHVRSLTTCAELGCNDEFAGSHASRLSLPLAAGEAVVVVVDGYAGSYGDFVLHLSEAPPCPEVDLGSTVPIATGGSTLAGGQELAGSCGGAGARERSHAFRAPLDGTYAFSTDGSSFDTVLYVRDGSCDGAELGCDDDAAGAQASLVMLPLSAGQGVVVVVDGRLAGDSGDFALRIDLAPACPADELGAVPSSASGATGGLPSFAAGSCGGALVGEASHGFTAPADGTYSFDTDGSSFDTVLYARDGGCPGAEIACSDDASGLGSASRLVLPLTAGQQISLFVDGQGESGAYVLHASAGPTCPDVDLGSVSPQSASGTTAGANDVFAGSCGGGAAPEKVFAFEAPTSAVYAMDTFGADLDTVLYVRDGSCYGPQLACNDDAGGPQSQVFVPMSAGQRVFVFVDGPAGTSGAFALRIAGP